MAKKCMICRMLKLLAVVLLLVVVAVAVLPLWIGPVVTGVANKVVPGVTGTGFHLGEFALNQYSGKLHVGDVQLQNPRRFFDSEAAESAEKKGVLSAVVSAAGKAVDVASGVVTSSSTNAVSLSSLDVDLSTASALTDTIHIREIVLRDLFIYGDLTFSNIREIADNAKGEDEEEVDGEVEVEGKEAGEEEGEGKKVVIDRVLIAGTKFKWGHLSVSLPDIEIKDIGKDEAVSDEGAWERILVALCEAADQAQTGLGTALKLAIEGGKAIGKGLGAAADLVTDGTGAAAGAAVDAAATAVKATGDATKAVTGVAGDAAKAVTGVAGDAAKAVTGAAGDAAKSATDAIKGLFK